MEPQQTIKTAYRDDTGELVSASDLLLMEEDEFTNLRRSTWRRTSKRDDHAPLTFVCTYCEGPLSLARFNHPSSTENRFFKHRSPVDRDCIWLHLDRRTAGQIMAMQYFGQNEGQEHRFLKQFIAGAMRHDSETAPDSVIVDQFQLGKVLKGERKRPDVRATWRGRPLVFEIQLSYTFISEVVKRDYFYEQEGSFLIWIFAKYEPGRAVPMDEASYNRRNLFVLDDEAKRASVDAGRLMLTCFHDVPEVDKDALTIRDVRHQVIVRLDDLSYPEAGKRPYYFDYPAARHLCETELEPLLEARRRIEAAEAEAERQAREKQVEEAKAAELLAEQRRQAEADKERRQDPWFCIYEELIRQGREIQSASSDRTDDFDLACMVSRIGDPVERKAAGLVMKYPYRQTVWKLLGIKLNEPLATGHKQIFETLAASLQLGESQTTQRPMMLLYLAAWEVYRPSMISKHEEWVRERAKVHRAIASERPIAYRPEADFLKVVRRLFPEMAGVYPVDESAALPPSSRFAWVTSIDLENAKKIRQRYEATHPETNWREVYGQMLRAMKEDKTPSEFINSEALRTESRPGVIRDFLKLLRVI